MFRHRCAAAKQACLTVPTAHFPIASALKCEHCNNWLGK